MKNVIFITIIFLFPFVLLGQWEPNVRLTNNSALAFTSLNNAWCVASSGSNVHVEWMDYRDGNLEIYYKHSLDNGTNWSEDARLTNNTSWSMYPSIAVSGSNVHVVWFDGRDGNDEIYYKYSLDNGINWSEDIRLTNNTAGSLRPSIAVSGSIVHVVWYDSRDGNWEIYYKRSLDNGINWEADTRLTNNTAFSGYASITVSGSNVHVVWFDGRDGNDEIYYKRSLDNGTNWSEDIRLTNNTYWSHYPSVAVSGLNVHVVWCDDWAIYYKRSLDNGINWSADTRLDNDSALSWLSSIAVSGSNVQVVWEDDRDDGAVICYKHSTDNGTNWEVDTNLTNVPAVSESPSVAVSGSYVHVVWCDDGDEAMYYKRNPTGNGIQVNRQPLFADRFSLKVYPNPAKLQSVINYSLPTKGQVSLQLFDISGRLVKTLVNQEKNTGNYSLIWNGTDDNNRKVGEGIYFCILKTDKEILQQKILMVK